QGAEATIAAREDPLEKRSARIMPLEAHAPLLQLAAQERLARFDLRHVNLRRPLKRGVRFGHEGRDAGGHLAAPRTGGRHFGRPTGDADEIRFGLAGKAEHEVELQRAPPETKDLPRRVDELVFLIFLLNDVAHALRARLGSEGEAGLTHATNLIEQG